MHTWRWGDAHYWIGANGSALPAPDDAGRVAGSAYLLVDDVPGTPRDLSLRTGIGDVAIVVDDDVSLEVRAHVLDGAIIVDDAGRPMTDDRLTVTLGPDRTRDVSVDVTISKGELRIDRRELTPAVKDRAPDDVPPFLRRALSSDPARLGKGVSMSPDGTVLLSGSAGPGSPVGAISPTGEIWTRVDARTRRSGVTVVVDPEDAGSEYLVLPDQRVITPSGTLIDVPATRADRLDEPAAPDSTDPPDSAD